MNLSREKGWRVGEVRVGFLLPEVLQFKIFNMPVTMFGVACPESHPLTMNQSIVSCSRAFLIPKLYCFLFFSKSSLLLILLILLL